MHLPKANTFIADDFTVEKVEKVLAPAEAMIIIESDQLRMWYKKDDTFEVPKAHVHLQFTSPQSYSTALNCVLSKLVVEVLKETLNEFSYQADVAGLEMSLDSNTDGLIVIQIPIISSKLHISGYNDKLGLLLDEIVSKLSNLEFSRETFELVKDELKRKYKNWQMESPHQHAMFYASLLTQEVLWHTSDKLKELEGVTYESLNTFIPVLLEYLHVEGLIHGNVNYTVTSSD